MLATFTKGEKDVEFNHRTIIRHGSQEDLLKLRATTFINNLEPEKDLEFEVSIKRYKNKRSLEQNAYYWGVIIEYMSRELGYTVNECHEVLKAELLPKVQIEYKGKILEVSGSTKKLNTKQFAEFIDMCIILLAEFGVIVPPPHYK